MGTADNKEITALFSGYGYQCAIVDYGDLAHHSDAADHAVQVNLAATMKWAVDEIQKIQQAARSGKPITKPRWPMIFLRTPKGWTGPRFVGGLPVENSFRARRSPLRASRGDTEAIDLQTRSLFLKPKPILSSLSSLKTGSTHTSLGSSSDLMTIASCIRTSQLSYPRTSISDWVSSN